MNKATSENINWRMQAFYMAGLLLVIGVYATLPIKQHNKIFGLYLFAFSLLLSLNIVPICRWLALRYNVLDRPSLRKVHHRPTPLLGGLAIFLSFLTTLVLFHRRIGSPEIFWWIIGISTVILLISTIDDYKTLPAKIRLLVQFLAAGIVVYRGVRISFLPDTSWGITCEVVLSLLWIVGITNAINFLDGMDGLATGYIFITASLLGIVAYQLVMPEYLYLLLALTGACLGFLPFNFRFGKSALIFLGDGGATFLGFLMGCLTIQGKWGSRNDVFHSKNEVAIVIPLLILGVAVFDAVFTYVYRFRRGEIRTLDDFLGYAGKDHFHHRLTAIGLPHKIAVEIIFLITLWLGFGAIVLRNARKIDTFLILLQSIIIFFLIGSFMVFVENRYLHGRDSRERDSKDKNFGDTL